MENESTKASKKGENGLNKCKFTKIIIQSSNKGTKKTNRINLSIPEPELPIKRFYKQMKTLQHKFIIYIIYTRENTIPSPKQK
jgi:hypothetical protein